MQHIYVVKYHFFGTIKPKKEQMDMPENNTIDTELYVSIGKQIKQARLNKNISLDTLSNLINGLKTKSTLKRYEDGKSRIDFETLKIICDQLGLNYLNVINIAREKLNNDKSEDIQELDIKIKFDDYFPLHYCSNLSAGSLEELLDNDPDAIVYVPIKFQLRKNRLHAFKVNGTSMDNVIPDGSIVITEKVDNALDLKDGTIVVAWVDNGATVKRLYAKESSVTLMPDSSDKSHRPIDVNLETSPIQIIGRVIWHMNPDDIEKLY